jgi:glyoxylase-like metal-dependent hydrolase (beta-lactamase superfamily II)
MSRSIQLPAGVSVLERGWLSSNNVVLVGRDGTALVDSGYASHAAQTMQLVEGALYGRRLDLLLNTHLHSDHCGGNSALQERYPNLEVRIPPGLAEQVRHWDPVALTYVPTGQECPRFAITGVLEPGAELRLAEQIWEVHAAPGHDPHSVVLFEPESRTLISADALWENGFGIVFQELEGERAFHEVAQTLDVIEGLRPQVVIPGHGRVFGDVDSALANARRRLDGWIRNPAKHARHAAKVLLKFKLLDVQQLSQEGLRVWALSTPYLNLVHGRYFTGEESGAWIRQLVDDLIVSGAARWENGLIVNA